MFKYEHYSSNNEIFEDNYSLFYSSIRNNIKETTIIICDNDNDNDNGEGHLRSVVNIDLYISNLFTDISETPCFSSFIDEGSSDEEGDFVSMGSSKLLTTLRKCKIKFEFLYTKKENKPYLLSSFSKSTNYSYKQIENITKQIINQINFLEKNNLTFLKIDLNDILIIENDQDKNEIKCAIINSSNLIYIFGEERGDKLIYIDYPFDKIFFMSPELKNIFEIPTYISHTTIYYNIGCLILFIYLQSIKKKNQHEINEGSIITILGNNDNLNYYLNNELIDIYNTKLFWFIKKSIIKNDNGERFLKY